MPATAAEGTAPQTPEPACSPGFQRVPERALGMALERAVPSSEEIFSYDFLKREHLKKQDHFCSQEKKKNIQQKKKLNLYPDKY